MRYDQPQLQEALASAYVVGALQGPARRRFEVLMRTRPALRRRVEDWEDRLTPLADGIPEVAPPPRLWQEIGRASCGERGCQYVYITGVADYIKKKNRKTKISTN